MPAWPAWMPDPLTTLVIALAVLCVALAVLNVLQYSKNHGTVGALKGTLDHIFEHGHAPEGTVLVPEHVVAVAPTPPQTPTEAFSTMAGRHLEPDKPKPSPIRRLV
jgi:hypothetical protein